MLDTIVSPIKSRSGRFWGYVAVNRDVTEKVRFEKQLRQAQKMEAIGMLAGGIAHDFNNILGVIIGCSELAMLNLPPDLKARADIEQVIDAGLRAKNRPARRFIPSTCPIISEPTPWSRSTVPGRLPPNPNVSMWICPASYPP